MQEQGGDGNLGRRGRGYREIAPVHRKWFKEKRLLRRRKGSTASPEQVASFSTNQVKLISLSSRPTKLHCSSTKNSQVARGEAEARFARRHGDSSQVDDQGIIVRERTRGSMSTADQSFRLPASTTSCPAATCRCTSALTIAACSDERQAKIYY